MHPDGTGLTRLTDDPARDWGPRFNPDGKSLTFYSNLSGKYDAWSMRLDGSGRTKLTDIAPGLVFPMFAPDGKRLVGAVIPHGAVMGTGPWPMTSATSKTIEGLKLPGGELTPAYWSRGGRWISGYLVTPLGEIGGFGVIDAATGKAHQLNDDSNGYDLAWMPDDRHVVYFTDQAKLAIQDVVTLEKRAVTGALPYPPDLIGGLVASPDGRTLYYAARQTQANIWLVRRSAPPSP
jgi:Tol biopolymer transport system component